MRGAVMVLSVCLATPVLAEEIKVDSKIDTVTVFPRGAAVERTTQTEIPAGTHMIVLNDLPAGTDLNSIRVEGKASGGLEIGAVDARRIQVLRRDSDASKSKRRRLENEIEQETDRLAALNAEVETKQTQKRYIENLAALPTSGGGFSGPQPRPEQDWAQLLTLIGTSLADVQRSILTHNIKIREVTRRIEDLKKELAELAPQQIQRTAVKINVVADAALTADLLVRYQVRNARWLPIYDARLETGSRNVPSKLVMTRRASISQETGEAWKNVKISLSTARPSGRSGAPEIYPITVDFRPERPPAPGAVAGLAAPQEAESRALRSSRAKSVARARIAKPDRVARERGARVQAAGYQATFEVPDRIDVANTGEAKNVKIETMQFEPSLVVRSVPKFDARAYLYAKLKLPKGIAPILRGQVMLFRDQTFVGRGRLPQLAAGEMHELGFGADDAVRIKYTKIAETRGETGIISSSRTDQRKFKISIKNLRERPISYSILDQRPESLNEEIKVELVGRTNPTTTNVKDRRGVLAWEGKLGPDKEQIIDFGYVISWPADKRIQYRR